MRVLLSLIVSGICLSASAVDCNDNNDTKAFCLAAEQARGCILGEACDGQGSLAEVIPASLFYLGKAEALATLLHSRGDMVGQVKAKLVALTHAITDPTWEGYSADGNWSLATHRSSEIALEARDRMKKLY